MQPHSLFHRFMRQGAVRSLKDSFTANASDDVQKN